MSIVIANGLMVTEAAYLYSDLVTDNPIVPDKVSIFSYDSIGSDGEYVGLQMYIGSDVAFEFLQPFPAPVASGKIPKAFPGSAMPADSIFQYTLSAGDITALGATIQVTGFLINNARFLADWLFSANQGSLTAGDTITFTGLPAKIDVTLINFNLS